MEPGPAQKLGEHGAWAALLGHLDVPTEDEGEAGDEGRGAEPEVPGEDPPKDRPKKWIDLDERLSEDQLRILRKEVTLCLAGKTGDLRLLDKKPEPEREREVAEVAALARLAFGLCRGEIDAPTRSRRK